MYIPFRSMKGKLRRGGNSLGLSRGVIGRSPLNGESLALPAKIKIFECVILCIIWSPDMLMCEW